MPSDAIADFIKSRELPSAEALSYTYFADRVDLCVRIYTNNFSDPGAGNPGRFQGVMVLLKMFQEFQASPPPLELNTTAAEWGEDESGAEPGE